MEALLWFFGCVVFNIIATLGVCALLRAWQMRGVSLPVQGDQR